MNSMQRSLRPPIQAIPANAYPPTPHLDIAKPGINWSNNASSKDGARGESGTGGPVEQQGIVDSSATAANAAKKAINAPRNVNSFVDKGISLAASMGIKVPPALKGLSPSLKKFGAVAKVAEIPLATLATINDIKNNEFPDASASGTKLATSTIEAATDVGTLMTAPTKGSALTHVSIPFQRGHPLRSNTFPMTPLRSASLAATPSPAGTSTSPGPASSSFVRGGPSRLPMRRKPSPPASTSQPSATPSSAGPAPTSFVRGGQSRLPVRKKPSPSSTTSPPSATSAAKATLPSHFVRGGPSRLPVRTKPLPPPRTPAPTMPAPSTAVTSPARKSSTATMLSRLGNSAKILGGAVDIYFGIKQVTQERESAGKGQGILTASSGVTGLGSAAAGLAGTFGVAGAATVSAGLAVASCGLSVVSLGMTAIPAIHGRDNRNRAVKLYNDFSHEMKQVEVADKHLSQRVNVDLKPTLQGLEDRYGIQTRNVWLNNNAADLLNQVNSPNNTTSGQWKPDEDGNVWSSFNAKYIRIKGTPHQDEVVLNLPEETDGARLVAAADCILTVPGDYQPDKRPATMKSLAAEPERYNAAGWSGSTGQPSMRKHYGYQTSAWGQHWETDVPLAVDAGPSYLSRAVSGNGRDTVVLINDTPIECHERPVPEIGYNEGALFAHDGKDAERLTAKQIAALAWEGKPTTIGDTFNVAESAGKAAENAYREAVYPTKDGVSYIRSPDPFARMIKTNPEHRTVVSLQNITHPTRVALHNAEDIVDIPGELGQNISVSLPPLPASTVDKRRLGIGSDAPKPIVQEHSILAGKGGKNVIHVCSYALGNGAILTVQATQRLSIEQFMGRS